MKKQYISFRNQNEPIQAIEVEPDTPYADVCQLLNLAQPGALLLVIGGAGNMEDRLKKELFPLCRDGIAAMAAEKSALVVDGGTQSGIMELIGQAASVQKPRPTLLGVAPEGMVTYPGEPEEGRKAYRLPLDPNHTCFVLVQGKRWGEETPMLYGLARELANNHPVITLLLNGGDIAKQEVLQSTRAGWPVIVITGSGRLADEIAMWWCKKSQPPAFLHRLLRKTDIASATHDQAMAEIIQNGDIYLFPYDGEVPDFKRLLEKLFFLQEKSALVRVWKRCTYYEQMANQRQRNFRYLQAWILCFGVLVTTLVLTNAQIQLLTKAQMQLLGWVKDNTFWDLPLRLLATLVAATLTFLINLSALFKWGNKWVSFRASSEALKREMYYYRTHTGNYNYRKQALQTDPDGAETVAEKQLIKKMSVVSSQLMQAQVHPVPDPSQKRPTALQANAWDQDDGFSDLRPEQYIRFRLKDQFDYYRRQAKKWERVLKRYHMLILLSGAVGTVLAALGAGLWTALTIVLMATFTLHMEQMRAVTIITKYNQAATDLESVRQWWLVLSTEEQKAPENFQKLVTSTEQILENEQGSWLQQMSDALTDLYKEPGKA